MKLAILLILSAALASADVLYDDGAVNGSETAWTINIGLRVADSFALASDSTLVGVNVGLWAFSGDTPLTVDWSIWNGTGPGGSPSGSELESGTGSLTNSFDFTNSFDYDIYTSSFLLPSIPLSAGTYWLQLENATTKESRPLYWDQNDGPSQAWDSRLGFLTADQACATLGSGTKGDCSETFQILGSTTGTATVPEPGSLALFGFGLVLLTGVLRRKVTTRLTVKN